MNIMLNADSYKASHYCQYPPGTKYISSYVEARSGKYSSMCFFGLQAFIKQYLLKPITMSEIMEAEQIITRHGLPFYRQGWEYILKQHAGFLPLAIEAVPEGSIIPIKNVVCQVRNTDPNCFWLTSYVETSLLRAIWYPTTVATRSYYIKNIMQKYLDETADSSDKIEFMLHDFGARGCSSLESSELGGMAHLVNFKGSDNLAAIYAAQQFYTADMPAFSIPAAEHGTIISWGREREQDAYQHILEKFVDYPAVSIVSDSYDLYSAIKDIWGGTLKNQVSQHPGVLVIRPDSGNPIFIVKECLRMLAQSFGCRENSKGYKVLPDNIRIIQGDGVSESVIEQVLYEVKAAGFSAENLVFGMGGELLQKLNRDTMSFAMKVSAVSDGKAWTGVAKQPSTDAGKNSRSGLLSLINNKTVACLDEVDKAGNMLSVVYRDGKITKDQCWSEIVERAKL